MVLVVSSYCQSDGRTVQDDSNLLPVPLFQDIVEQRSLACTKVAFVAALIPVCSTKDIVNHCIPVTIVIGTFVGALSLRGLSVAPFVSLTVMSGGGSSGSKSDVDCIFEDISLQPWRS